jgi:hypothetical protein
MCDVEIGWPVDERTDTGPPAPVPSRKAKPRKIRLACRFQPLSWWSSRFSSAGMKIEEDGEVIEGIPLTPSFVLISHPPQLIDRYAPDFQL